MTRRARPALANVALLLAGSVHAAGLVHPAPASAQVGDYGPSTEDSTPPDPCADSQADKDVIVVCRRFESGERYTFDAPTRADAEVTGSGAPRAPDVFGLPPCSSYAVCMRFGSVPPPAIMVDFASLPKTPEGSEAALLYGGPTTADTPVDEAVAAPPPAEPAATP